MPTIARLSWERRASQRTHIKDEDDGPALDHGALGFVYVPRRVIVDFDRHESAFWTSFRSLFSRNQGRSFARLGNGYFGDRTRTKQFDNFFYRRRLGRFGKDHGQRWHSCHIGANIGTSISSTLMALAHSQSDDKREFPRAFSGAVVSDVFNFLGVFVFFPLHLLFKLFFNGKGFFELITGLFVDSNSQEKGEKIPNVVKVATGPVADLVLKINKDVYKVLSGPGMPELGVTETVQNEFGINYNIGQNRTKLALAQKIYNEKIAEASLIKGGLMKAVGASNAVGGALCLVIAIGIVIWALLQLVASLKKLFVGWGAEGPARFP